MCRNKWNSIAVVVRARNGPLRGLLPLQNHDERSPNRSRRRRLHVVYTPRTHIRTFARDRRSAMYAADITVIINSSSRGVINRREPCFVYTYVNTCKRMFVRGLVAIPGGSPMAGACTDFERVTRRGRRGTRLWVGGGERIVAGRTMRRETESLVGRCGAQRAVSAEVFYFFVISRSERFVRRERPPNVCPTRARQYIYISCPRGKMFRKNRFASVRRVVYIGAWNAAAVVRQFSHATRGRKFENSVFWRRNEKTTKSPAAAASVPFLLYTRPVRKRLPIGKFFDRVKYYSNFGPKIADSFSWTG